MNKKKKKFKYKKIIIFVILFIIFFILLFYFLNDDRKNNIVFITLKDLSANITKIVNMPFNSRKEIDNNIVEGLNKDYENEIKNLKDALELNKLNSNKKFVNATVIKRSTNYWYNIITIDKGKNYNLKKGLAVINNNGLIGKIIKVNKYSSDIKLLISPNNENYISAMFRYDDNYYYGLIDNYDVIKNELLLKNVIGDFDKEKVLNTEVTTSGLTDSFTSGLLIGKIKEIKKDSFGISNDIIVEPTVNFNSINIVSVIVGDK